MSTLASAVVDIQRVYNSMSLAEYLSPDESRDDKLAEMMAGASYVFTDLSSRTSFGAVDIDTISHRDRKMFKARLVTQSLHDATEAVLAAIAGVTLSQDSRQDEIMGNYFILGHSIEHLAWLFREFGSQLSEPMTAAKLDAGNESTSSSRLHM